LIENKDGTCGNKTTNIVYKEVLNMDWNIQIFSSTFFILVLCIDYYALTWPIPFLLTAGFLALLN
jgi:hypothetical protein